MKSNTGKTRTLNRVLIANRGEIVTRVAKTCRDLGIDTIGIYSEADRTSLHTKVVDEAYCVGEAESQKSYLNMDKILDIAKEHKVDGIHPGYGFLSENPAFAKRCKDEGVLFLGPSSEVIKKMGAKDEARAIAESLNVPVIPGYSGRQDEDTLTAEAQKIGFPIMLKAAAGGGGKGMRRVYEESELRAAIKSCRGEAKRYFDDDALIVERFFPNSRHVEIQVAGDEFGNVVHCFERDCSVQRRHQKVIEESPCPYINKDTRQRLCAHAVLLAKEMGYVGVGTVEFLLDMDGEQPNNIYFLEMNTRLQVEHTVTEEVCGIDLVSWQLAVHAGKALPVTQEDIATKGHSVECRVYAEDPEADFAPCVGTILRWDAYEGEGIRYDSGIEEGSDVSVHYDPLLFKVITKGETREVAYRRMIKALHGLQLMGVKTNLAYLGQHKFWGKQGKRASIDNESSVAKVLLAWKRSNPSRHRLSFIPKYWHSLPQPVKEHKLYINGKEHFVTENSDVSVLERTEDTIRVSLDNRVETWTVIKHEGSYYLDSPEYPGAFLFQFENRFPESSRSVAKGDYIAPMPGKVLNVLVNEGHIVTKGDPLITIESMKMEQTLTAHFDGRIEGVFVNSGDIIAAQTKLLHLEMSV